jgi:hypothetical protein
MKIIIPFLIFCLVAICNAELRTWTAVNGKEVEAEFVSNEKGIVKLKLKSGKVFEVPLNKLSKSDQEFLKAKSSSGSLADTIVGRLITFKSDNGYTMEILLNEDGVMMYQGLKGQRLTYKIEGNEVLIFKKEERDGGISFSSSSPKVGDQVEVGPKKRKESAKITKIENAPQTAVNSSTEKQQKLKEEVQPKENSAGTQPTAKKSDQSLYDAALLGETAKVKQAIADGADVNTKGALHNAVVASLDSGDNEIVEMFISNGANVNAKDDEGLTALDIIKSLSGIAGLAKNLRAALGKTDDDMPVGDLLRKHGAKTSEELKGSD